MDDEKLEYILSQLSDDVKDIKKNYLTRLEFNAKFTPIQKAVFFVACAIFTSYVGLIAAVLSK